HLVAVQGRQVPVEDDHVVVVDLGHFQAAGAVVGDVDGHPPPPQPARERAGELGFVLDDEHPHRALRSQVLPGASGSMAGPGGGSAVASGKRTLPDSPPPGAATAGTVAPCAEAPACTIDRPTPLPRAEPVRSGASRRNGWKSSPTCSAGMAGPLLDTARVACPPAVPVLSDIQPPGMLCRIAFRTRLAARWVSSAGSPVTGAGRSEQRSAGGLGPAAGHSWSRARWAI